MKRIIKFVIKVYNALFENLDIERVKRNNMKYLLQQDDYISRRNIVEVFKNIGIQIEIINILLFFESTKQRSFLVKTEEEFFILNDNKGKLVMVVRQSLEMFKFKVDKSKEYHQYFTLKFLNFDKFFYVSKVLFESEGNLISKLNQL